jgi:hypothetical protein
MSILVLFPFVRMAFFEVVPVGVREGEWLGAGQCAWGGEACEVDASA